MGLSWGKANYGGTDSKKGGGKLDSPMPTGSKGIPAGTSAPKASVERKKGIDSPGLTGNKGITTQKGFPSGKAPRD